MPDPTPAPLPPTPGPQIAEPSAPVTATAPTAAPARRAAPATPTTPAPPVPTRPLPQRQPPPRRDDTAAFLDDPPAESWGAADSPPAPRRASFADRFLRHGPRPGGKRREPRREQPRLVARARRARWLAVGGIVLGVVLLWFAFSLFQPFKGDGSGSVAVQIPRGAGTGDIGDVLADKGVISRSVFFSLRTKLAGKGSDLKPGNYVLKKGMSYGAVIDALSAGPPPPKVTKITITEGRSRAEASSLLKKTSLTGNYYNLTKSSLLLNPRRYGAPRSVRSLEGFLFPATYDVRVGAPLPKLIDQQLATFKERFGTVALRAARKKNLTPYEVLTIASMIEREAARARERPLIAAVIYNRLKQGIPLGIDATIRYATGNWTAPLRQSELNRPGPYNTRLTKGLPPTPIGSPGLASIRAAAHPAPVSYLYYVVKPNRCGEHAFSSTDAQFQRDADRYSSARAQRGGKSPTSCPK